MTEKDFSERRAVNIALLTVSDTRTFDTDSSGHFLEKAIKMDGHYLASREIVIDDVYKISYSMCSLKKSTIASAKISFLSPTTI